MATYYLTDADLTDRLPSLTNSELSLSAVRALKLRLPATALVDSMIRPLGPFADVDTGNTPTDIQQAAVAYALGIAHRILANNPDVPAAVTWDGIGNRILKVQPDGTSRWVSASATVVGMPQITRDRDDEAEDEQDIVV